MKTSSGVEIQLHAFLTSALDGGEWSASPTGCFTPRETAPGTHWIGGWVGRIAAVDAVAKRIKDFHCPCPESDSGRLACNPVTILTELPRILIAYMHTTRMTGEFL
jgi:hypothetical protein